MKREESCKVIMSDIIKQCNKHNHKKCFNTNIIIDTQKSIEVIKSAYKILDEDPAVLTINTQTSKSSQFVIVGDLHGNLESLARIINNFGYPPYTRYLFLGDFVDRGKNSCAVIVLLYALKCLYKNDIFLIRGNHEFKSMTDYYGFKEECIKKMTDGELFYNMVINSFSKLPICAILNNSIFCVHGGISSLVNNREQLLNLKKVGDELTYEESTQAEFFWNDPTIDYLKFGPGQRGIGCVFGQDALDEFLEKMQFEFVIRSHQSQMNGYEYPFDKDGKILTIFSSLDYCGMLNEAAVAIISFDGDNLKLETQTFNVLSQNLYKKMRIILPEDIIMNNYHHLSINFNLLPNLILT